MVGPNCFGVINTDPAVRLNGIFSPIEPARGNIAFGSQSGALGVVIPDLSRRWRIGLSSFVSIANKADVGENDLLMHWEHDPGTRLIALYLDVAFRLHPLTDRAATELVNSGRLARVLRGYRGGPPADRAALIDTLMRVSALLEALPEVAEMDLNPVLVLPSSRGTRVVDARIRVTPAENAPG